MNRQDIADALSAVATVNGFTKRPTTPRPGDAWPLIRSAERDTATDVLKTWRVVVMLPGDERTAWDFVNENLEPVWDALETLGIVDTAEPAVLESEGGNLPVLHYTLRSPD